MSKKLDAISHHIKGADYEMALQLLEEYALDPDSSKRDMLYNAHYLTACDHLNKREEFEIALNNFKSYYPGSHNPYVLAYYYHARRMDFVNAISSLKECPMTSLASQDLRLRTAILFKKIQAEIFSSATSVRPDFSTPINAKPPCSDLAICMMVKDEDDIIRLNLEHHYKLGARKFFIIDNGSADHTRDEIQSFSANSSDALVVIISDPVAGYYQQGKTMALCSYAADYLKAVGKGVNYLLPLDADEFVVLDNGHGFLDILQYLSNACPGMMSLVFDLCDATSNSDWVGGTLEQLYANFRSISYASQNVVTKNMIHVSQCNYITMGNHTLQSPDIESSNLVSAISLGGRIIHLALRGFSHAKKKVINGGKAYLEATELKESHFGGHWKQAYAEYLKDGDNYIRSYFEKYQRRVHSEINCPPSNFNYRI